LVERKEFNTFTTPFFEDYPGIVALGWVPRIPSDLRDAHQEAVRRQGFEQYKIFQRNDLGQAVSAEKRKEHYPILFIEPSPENHLLIGFDLASNPSCHKAIQQAIATRRQIAIVCPPLDKNENDSSLLYVLQPAWNEHSSTSKRPADQPEIDGFVLGVFHLTSIIESSLEYFAPVGIDVDVTGLSDLGKNINICTRPSPLRAKLTESEAAQCSLSLYSEESPVTGHLDIANLNFTITCVPIHPYLATFHTWKPHAVFFTGLVITCLIVGYLLLLTERTARIEQLATKRAHELNESELRFRHLVDNAGDAFFLRDQDGKILDINQWACDNLGYTREELLSMKVADFDIDFIPKNLEKYSSLPLEAYPITFEAVHRRKDGTTFPVEIRLTAMEVNGRRFMLALARDITEQKIMIERSREGERKLRAILDQTFQFIGLVTPEGILTAANRSALAFSGVPESEVLQKPFWDTPWWSHSPTLQEELRQAVKTAAQGNFVRMEVTHYAANGDLHWIDFSLKPVKDESGKVLFLIPEGRDITDRKRAEETAHEEHRLLREMLDLHERDRKIMAYEIHDGLAQQLTGALYKLQSAEPQMNSDPDAVKKTHHEGMELLREAIAETRRLIGGLRPPVLDESGIVAAIEYLVAAQQKEGGAEIEFVHDADIERMAPPLESALFRIVQECLTNAHRHSQSKKIHIELHQFEDRVCVDVQDWGVGFNPEDVNGGHFGLLGIHERARLLGGSVVLKTSPGQGVHISVKLPLIV
jgi:PAS domain S-box-containing protein